MNKLTLNKRELLGKKAKRVSKEGMIPVVVYNSKGESKPAKGSYGEIVKLLEKATTTTMIDLDLDGEKIKTVIKEVDTHPITDHISHVAFFEIDESAEAVFSVPFTLKGISPAVKNNLGVLVQASQSIDIKAKPSDLVAEIEIDISKLDLPGKTISVGDLELPKGISLIREEDANTAIVTVTKLQKTIEVEDAEAAEAAGEDAEDEEAVEGEEGAEAPAEGEAEEKKEE